jgi:hypothetical protein
MDTRDRIALAICVALAALLVLLGGREGMHREIELANPSLNCKSLGKDGGIGEMQRERMDCNGTVYVR